VRAWPRGSFSWHTLGALQICDAPRHAQRLSLPRNSALKDQLPGDAEGNGSSSASDVLAIIDQLNRVWAPPMEPWQCDADRSGVCNPADVLAVIDLLNGAGAFDRWNNQTIPACPTD